MAKILVVDDQRNMRTTLSMMLRTAGHDVSEAVDGEEASEKVENDSYDLVLTDLKMGGKDGIEVLRHAKESSPLTEVIEKHGGVIQVWVVDPGVDEQGQPAACDGSQAPA